MSIGEILYYIVGLYVVCGNILRILMEIYLRKIDIYELYKDKINSFSVTKTIFGYALYKYIYYVYKIKTFKHEPLYHINDQVYIVQYYSYNKTFYITKIVFDLEHNIFMYTLTHMHKFGEDEISHIYLGSDSKYASQQLRIIQNRMKIKQLLK